MPAGCTISGNSRSLCVSAIWMRRSISRTESRYPASLLRSPRPSVAPKPGELFGDRIEKTAVRPEAAEPRFALGAVAGAEQVFEDRARVGLHRQRRRGVAPGDRGAVGAAVAVLALAHEVVGLERQLERRQLGLLLRLPRRDLIHRDARVERGVPAGRLVGMRAREEGRLGPRVVAVTFVQQRIRVLVGHAAQHEHAIPNRGQRRHDRRELEAALLPSASRRACSCRSGSRRRRAASLAPARRRMPEPSRRAAADAMAAPMPRSTVRRERLFFVITMTSSLNEVTEPTALLRRRRDLLRRLSSERAGSSRFREPGTTSGSRWGPPPA